MRAICTLSFAAVLLGAVPAFAGGADPGEATDVQREQAQTRFSRGKSLYDSGKFDDAATEFRASNDIVASPNARLYLSRALREGGHYVDAYVEFGRTEVEAREHAKEDGRYEKAATTAAAERDALKPKLGFVIVHVDHADEGTKLTVGGEVIRRAGWTEPAPVTPGATDIVVDEPGRTAVHRTVSVTAGQTENVTIDALTGTLVSAPSPTPESTPPPTPTAHADTSDHSNLRPFAYIAGGVGVAGIATFVVAGLLANSTYGDLENQCGTSKCSSSVDDEVSRGKTEQLLANVGLVVGVIGVGAGATLFILSSPKSKQTAQNATVSPVLAPGWAGVRGQF